MPTVHTALGACFFCAGDGYVNAQPGNVEMPCPFCKGTGNGPASLEAYDASKANKPDEEHRS